jgi:hypothetical protein
MENELMVQLPQEVEQLAQSVSAEKKNEVIAVLNHVFNGVSKMREQLDNITVVDENDKVNMKLANTIRLGVRQVRLDAEKEFDQKRSDVQMAMLSFKTEDSLWLKSKQTMQILTKEIEEIAKWKETTKERFDIEQKELQTQQRLLKIQKFNQEATRFDVEQVSDATFEMLLKGAEAEFNEKIEAEKKAEAERLAAIEAERLERERIITENTKLQKEAEEKEKQLQAERLKAQQEAEIERKKQAEILAEQKRISDEKQAEIEKQAKIEREENERLMKIEREKQTALQAELKAKQAAELKAQQEKQAAELKAKQEAEKAAKAPAKDKMLLWVDSFLILGIGEENLSEIQIKTATDIMDKFSAFKKWAKSEIEKL